MDILEAGFPVRRKASSTRSAEIASSVRGPVIAALARTTEGDVGRAAEALKGAERWRIHTFISTSQIHMEDMLRMSHQQVLDAIRDNVKLAVSYTDDVEFCAQDATRTELDFLLECFRVAVECGATTINVPDTVGYATPTEFGELVADRARGHARTTSSSRRTATTIWGWRSRTRWPASRTGPARWRSRSTGSASARATARSRRSP